MLIDFYRFRRISTRSSTCLKAAPILGKRTRWAKHITLYVYVHCGTSEPQAILQITLTRADDDDGIIVQTGDSACSFVLLAGQPIGEKVVQYGPVRIISHVLSIY